MKDKRRLTRIGFVADESFNYFISLFVTTTLLGYITDSLGFSDAEQGIISAIPTLCLLAQLLAPAFSGMRSKKLVTIGMPIAHFAFLCIYLFPLFDKNEGIYGFIPYIVIALLFIGNFINNALNSTRLVWFMKSVDDDKRGSFTAVKEMISLAGGIVISLALGRIADAYRSDDGTPDSKYYILCAVIIGVLLLLNFVSLVVSEDESELPKINQNCRIDLRKLYQNNVIKKILVIDIAWYFALGVSTSFHASYLRDDLSFDFTTITILTAVTSVCRFIVSPLMGRLGDKYGFKMSMLVCLVLEAIAFGGAALTANGVMKWMYIVYAAFSGFAQAGINSGLMNLVYDYVGPAERSSVLGIKGALGGTVGFISTMLGGVVLSMIQSNGGVKLLGTILSAQQVLSFVSLCAIVLLVVYVKLVVFKLKRIEI